MRKASKQFSRKNDRFFGVPALFAMSGLMPAKSSGALPKTVVSIGILRMESVRDTLYISHILALLKVKYPAARIIFFAGNDNFEAAKNMPYVNTAVKIFPEDTKKSIKIIRESEVFDIWIDFGVWSRFESILSCAANALFKVGFKTEGEHRHYAYDKVAKYDKKAHITNNYAKLAEIIGAEYKVNFQKASVANKQKLVIFNMYSDNAKQAQRAPNDDHWRYLLMVLSKKGYRIALTGNTENKDDAEKFMEEVGPSFDIDYCVGRLDWKGLSALVSSAELVVSGDSAVLYCAAIAGVPCIGVYGAISATKYAPSGKYFTAVEVGIGCNGCQDFYGDEVCINEKRCMDAVSVQQLEEAVMSMLAR